MNKAIKVVLGKKIWSLVGYVKQLQIGRKNAKEKLIKAMEEKYKSLWKCV